MCRCIRACTHVNVYMCTCVCVCGACASVYDVVCIVYVCMYMNCRVNEFPLYADRLSRPRFHLN